MPHLGTIFTEISALAQQHGAVNVYKASRTSPA